MERIIFLRVGWMDKYEGLEGDKITGGGSFVQREGYGHEIFNFKPNNGKLYGYAKSPGETINIRRIAKFPVNNDFIDDVTVIWVAGKPTGGVFIVGWYKNSRVYRNYKNRPNEFNPFNEDDKFVYIVEAKTEDCELLPRDERIIEIPTGKGGMGQSNVWYADSDEHNKFRTMVLQYINQENIPQDYVKEKAKSRQKGKPIQIDPLKREKVEKNAVEEAIKFYENLGYTVSSVEKDNLGWDLEAILGNDTFKIEVKGLSASDIIFELTANEYRKMEDYKKEYIICVVTDALNSNIKLHRFLFSKSSNHWEDDDGNHLNFQEIISARCSI